MSKPSEKNGIVEWLRKKNRACTAADWDKTMKKGISQPEAAIRLSIHNIFQQVKVIPSSLELNQLTKALSKMKRKNEESQHRNGSTKKRAISDNEAKQCFGKEVFSCLDDYTKKYAQSEPLDTSVSLNCLIADSI
jgi:hypothetical protein